MDSDIDINGKSPCAPSPPPPPLLLQSCANFIYIFCVSNLRRVGRAPTAACDTGGAAYEPVDRNFDAIELTAECDLAYVDVLAAELQVRASAHVVPHVRAHNHAAHRSAVAARGFRQLLQVRLQAAVLKNICARGLYLTLLLCSLQDLLPLLPRKS